MPRLRARVEIKRIAEDRYAVNATYGTRTLADNVMTGDGARNWLWKHVQSAWADSLDVSYSEEVREETAQT